MNLNQRLISQVRLKKGEQKNILKVSSTVKDVYKGKLKTPVYCFTVFTHSHIPCRHFLLLQL